MHEPLLRRIDELERANRRWKTIALVLGVLLGAVFATGGTFITILGLRVITDNGRAVQAMEQAHRAEAEARMQAEVARMQVERAAQEARRNAGENP